MAQDISLLGANYSGVPAVTLPKTGGGTARFTDVTPTTAVASDVANGKIFFKADGSQDTGTASGGGGSNYTLLAEKEGERGIWAHQRRPSHDDRRPKMSKKMCLFSSNETQSYLRLVLSAHPWRPSGEKRMV